MEIPTEFIVELFISQKVVSKNQGLQSFSTKGNSSFLLWFFTDLEPTGTKYILFP